MGDDQPSGPELEPRQPTVEDLRDLGRELHRCVAKYVVIGGFAIRHWFAQRGEERPGYNAPMESSH